MPQPTRLGVGFTDHEMNHLISVGSIPLGPKGPGTQYLGIWDLGNSNSITGFGQVYHYWVLGPLGIIIVITIIVFMILVLGGSGGLSKRVNTGDN